MGDRLDRLLQADTKRRPPVPFNPWRPERGRPERRTARTYSDPTGKDATDRILAQSKEKKK